MSVAHPELFIAVPFTLGANQMYHEFSIAEFTPPKHAPGVPALAGSTGGGVSYVARNVRDYSSSQHVTGGYFEILGVRPVLGRTITPQDDATRAPVAVIGEDLWRDRFAGDPTVLGEKIAVNDQPFTIVGVIPRSYRSLFLAGEFSIAIPFGARGLVVPPNSDGPPVSLTVIGRLADGMTRENAGAALDRAYRQCCPRATRGHPAQADQQLLIAEDASRGLSSPKMDLRSEYRRILAVLMAGVAIVLLIACANVGNLLLARATSRRREIAVRMSMGATRSRLVRQLLVESLELALAGAFLGLVVARLGTSVLAHNLPPMAAGMTDVIALRPSPPILGFTIGVTFACTMLFGLVPALSATRTDIVSPLKEGTTTTGNPRWWSLDRGFVVAQVALALVLVCAAALFVTTLRNLRQFDGGYKTSRVLLVNVDVRQTPWESRGLRPLYPDIVARVRALPGVEQVAVGTTMPLFGGRSRSHFAVPGYQPAPDEDMGAWNNSVTPGFFGTTGIGLRAGRDFDAGDTETSEPVVIVNESFAKRFLFGRNPIGATVTLLNWRPARQARIVGVANDARYYDLRAPAEEWYYFPLSQYGGGQVLDFAVRTTGDPVAVAAAVTREIDAVVPGIRIRGLGGVEKVLNDALSRERLSAALAALFGIFALGLAAVGLYGVVSYNVSRRTAEIGIRMALGATTRDALWLVVRQTLTMMAIGLAIGVPLAFAASKAIGAQLYGIDANDPRALVGAALLLAIAGGVASVVPSRRAASVDPAAALRAEG